MLMLYFLNSSFIYSGQKSFNINLITLVQIRCVSFGFSPKKHKKRFRCLAGFFHLDWNTQNGYSRWKSNLVYFTIATYFSPIQRVGGRVKTRFKYGLIIDLKKNVQLKSVINKALKHGVYFHNLLANSSISFCLLHHTT